MLYVVVSGKYYKIFNKHIDFIDMIKITYKHNEYKNTKIKF